MPVLIGNASDIVQSGNRANLTIETGLLELIEEAKIISCEPMPKFLLELIEAGGLVPHLEKRFAKEKIIQ